MNDKTRMLLDRVVSAADAFLAPIQSDFDEEHGITSRDAQRGALAMMVHLGVLTEGEKRAVERHWKACDLVQERRRALAYRERRAAMTPEQRKVQDGIAKTMQSVLTDSSFERLFDSPFMQSVRSAADEGSSSVIQSRPGSIFKKASVLESDTNGSAP
jgi:hypothetical protein